MPNSTARKPPQKATTTTQKKPAQKATTTKKTGGSKSKSKAKSTNPDEVDDTYVSVLDRVGVSNSKAKSVNPDEGDDTYVSVLDRDRNEDGVCADKENKSRPSRVKKSTVEKLEKDSAAIADNPKPKRKAFEAQLDAEPENDAAPQVKRKKGAEQDLPNINLRRRNGSGIVYDSDDNFGMVDAKENDLKFFSKDFRDRYPPIAIEESEEEDDLGIQAYGTQVPPRNEDPDSQHEDDYEDYEERPESYPSPPAGSKDWHTWAKDARREAERYRREKEAEDEGWEEEQRRYNQGVSMVVHQGREGGTVMGRTSETSVGTGTMDMGGTRGSAVVEEILPKVGRSGGTWTVDMGGRGCSAFEEESMTKVGKSGSGALTIGTRGTSAGTETMEIGGKRGSAFEEESMTKVGKGGSGALTIGTRGTSAGTETMEIGGKRGSAVVEASVPREAHRDREDDQNREEQQVARRGGGGGAPNPTQQHSRREGQRQYGKQVSSANEKTNDLNGHELLNEQSYNLLDRHRAVNRPAKPPTTDRLKAHVRQQQSREVEEVDEEEEEDNEEDEGDNEEEEEEEKEDKPGKKRKTRTSNPSSRSDPTKEAFYSRGYKKVFAIGKAMLALDLLTIDLYPVREEYQATVLVKIMEQAVAHCEKKLGIRLSHKTYRNHRDDMVQLLWNNVASIRTKWKGYADLVVLDHFKDALTPKLEKYEEFQKRGYGQAEWEQTTKDQIASNVKALLSNAMYHKHGLDAEKRTNNYMAPALGDLIYRILYTGEHQLGKLFPEDVEVYVPKMVAAAGICIRAALLDHETGTLLKIQFQEKLHKDYYTKAIQDLAGLRKNAYHWAKTSQRWEYWRMEHRFRGGLANSKSFSQGFINNLCGLPELTTLSIAGSVGLNVGSSPLKFQKLRLLDLSGWHTLDRVDHSGWIPLLRPELLTEFQLQIHPHRIREIAPSFPHVTKLRLTLVASEHAVDIRPILPKFAALRILAILDNAEQREEPNDRGVIPSFLPPLQEFTGPVWALKTFLHIPTLAHLTIGYCNVQQVLLTELQSIGAQLTITSLRLSVFSFTQTFFTAVFKLFPALTALHIDAATTDGQADIFLETFAESIPLPPHLAQLALAWNNAIVDVDAPIYPKFRRNLTAQYPTVDAVLLCFFNAMRLWRRTADVDKEVNETAFMQGDGLGYHNILSKVEIMRDTFNYTWGEVSRTQ
ncbi:hypothetical protein C8R46DRAFT_1219018 [Mycena filopes]|nr:hypothetical protein C8R46DRAFT_1219018 [Mycena filopes]